MYYLSCVDMGDDYLSNLVIVSLHKSQETATQKALKHLESLGYSRWIPIVPGRSSPDDIDRVRIVPLELEE